MVAPRNKKNRKKGARAFSQQISLTLDKLLIKLRRFVLTGPCTLCHAPCSDGMALCHRCYRRLPFLHLRCRLCALPLPHHGICGECQQSTAKRRLDASYALTSYQEGMPTLIHRIKYQADFHLLHLFACALARRIRVQHKHGTMDAVLPVPLHASKLRARGFNQADRIASQIARTCAWPLDRHALRRKHDSPSQTGLSRTARRNNVRDCFAVNQNHCQGKRLLLVDDVMTSGATLREIASCCRAAGAQSVSVAIICRTDQPGWRPMPSTSITPHNQST